MYHHIIHVTGPKDSESRGHVLIPPAGAWKAGLFQVTATSGREEVPRPCGKCAGASDSHQRASKPKLPLMIHAGWGRISRCPTSLQLTAQNNFVTFGKVQIHTNLDVSITFMMVKIQKRVRNECYLEWFEGGVQTNDKLKPFWSVMRAQLCHDYISISHVCRRWETEAGGRVCC